MATPVILILVLVAFGLVYVGVPLCLDVFLRWRRPRMLACPERRIAAEVEVDALHAALTTPFGGPRHRIRHCSLLSPGERCAGTCLEGLP